MVDVSVIIVAWNVRQLLHDCLKSVYEKTRDIDFEVIYVDNASEDGSVEMVKEQFAEVRIIENDKNEGFIKANNQGIEIAHGRYVLLLNSDTILLDNAIARTVRFADANPDVGVVGCKVLSADGTLRRTCFMYPSILNEFLAATYLYKIFHRSKFFGRERMTWWDFNDVREVQAVSGCFSMVRAKAAKQVGLMDETYFVYGDDPDWCYRFRKAGWKVMYAPDGRIIHYGGQSTKLMSENFLLQLHGSKLIFMKLHRNRLALPLARLLMAMFFFLRLPYWFVTAIIHKNRRAESLQTARAYLKGGLYCLIDWKRLLMNRDAVKKRL